jgi:hypothetical protein
MLGRLSSVHAVLGIHRQATEHDILITTILETLRNGALTDVELFGAARAVWPGSGITPERLVRALQIAGKAGYVVHAPGDSETTWALSRSGARDVEASRDWAQDIIADTARDLRARVAAAGVELTDEAATVWTHHLELALHASIRQAFAAYQGEVVQQSDWWLTPRTYDRDALVNSIESTTAESTHSSLLTGLAFEAIDPLSPFGSDLVTHITIGYTLHAFMGRRDHIGVRAAIGALNGDRVILDTPVLLELVGAPSQREPIEQAIRAAITAHMEVIALDHYLEELRELIQRNGRVGYPEVRETLASGVDAGILAGVVEDRVIALWLRAVENGIYRTWEDFEGAAATLDARLTGLGVMVRPHGNHETALVARVEAILAEEATNRGQIQRKRDADTIVMARRSRERLAPDRPFWPGAWVVTSDRHMNPAYSRAFEGDPFPVTITPGRLAGLISSCSSPATMEDLAVSAATLLQSDSFLAIAARYPVPVAIGLAQALGPSSGGSQLDMRLAQMTPAELMEEQPDIDATDDEVGVRVTAAVMTMRAERLNASYQAGEARLRRNADAATMTARAAEALSEAHSREQHAAEADRDEARAELERIRAAAAVDQIKSDRRWKARFGYLAIAVAIAVALLQSDPRWFVLAIVGLIIFWNGASKWTHDLTYSWTRLLPGVALEGFGLALTLVWPK